MHYSFHTTKVHDLPYSVKMNNKNLCWCGIVHDAVCLGVAGLVINKVQV